MLAWFEIWKVLFAFERSIRVIIRNCKVVAFLDLFYQPNELFELFDLRIFLVTELIHLLMVAYFALHFASVEIDDFLELVVTLFLGLELLKLYNYRNNLILELLLCEVGWQESPLKASEILNHVRSSLNIEIWRVDDQQNFDAFAGV